MKQFNSTSMVVFDSTIAHFKLSIEAKFAKKMETGEYRSKVYTKAIKDRNGNFLYNIANLNPDIYLVLAYKSDTFEGGQKGIIYTSYPQLFKLRAAFEKIKNLIVDNSGFAMVDNKLAVRPDCQEPVIIADIGQRKQSLSLNLRVITIEGSEGEFPAVSIQVADAETPCVLSVDEFLTVYTIINDLDLSMQQTILSGLYLMAEGNQQQPHYNNGYYNQNQQQMPQQYPQQQRQYLQQPQGNSGYQPRPQQGYTPAPQPQYGRGGYQPQPAPERTFTAAPASTYKAPAAPTMPVHNEEKMPATNEEAEVFTTDYDDSDEIAKIFEDK